MMRIILSVSVLTLFVSSAFAAPKKVAVVKLLRGIANATSIGKSVTLKTEDWVEDGSVVKTEEKSFVKLVFLDKSTMNIGPNSEMKIEKFNGKDSGVIDLVKGKIRSQVTKDYLQIQDKDKSKLFIKTKNAVMGVRGTDFMISTNGINTSTVLFEGEVVFNNLPDPGTTNTSSLEQTVNAGVRMVPGEFSVVDAQSPPTVPSLLNVQQLEKLEKNPNFASDSRTPASASEASKSVVPPGLSGAAVSNTSDTLKTEVAAIAEAPAPVIASSGPANGFVIGDSVKPTNGSFVDINTGVIIPPAPGSVLDSNTNTYIPAPGSGTVASDGSYVPPAGVTITPQGQLMVTVVDANGAQSQKEVPKPSPAGAVGPVVNTSVTAVTPAQSGDAGRGPASTGPAPVNNFTTAATNPALNNPVGAPVAGPGSIFNAGQVGNTQIAPPSASANPTSEPAVTSGAAATNGAYTINVNHSP